MSAPLILTDRQLSPRPAEQRDAERRATKRLDDPDQQLSQEDVYRVLMEEMSRLKPATKSSAA
ncbi:MAG: hypothetical protein AAF754_14130 [Pseudomonadota bacterium]